MGSIEKPCPKHKARASIASVADLALLLREGLTLHPKRALGHSRPHTSHVPGAISRDL